MTSSLDQKLAAALRGEVDGDTRRRAEYSTDASNYRVVPQVVAFPCDANDVVAALDLAHDTGTPVTVRGGGTSVAGNAIGPGLVLDLSRHMTRILDIDPDSRTARVEPGVILADLQEAAAGYGLRFGPDPSTHARATLGGMIGNNACGPHAVAFGRTADNVVSLDVVDGRGRRFIATNGAAALDVIPELHPLVMANLALIRQEFGRFGRQVSGMSMEHLLPENNRSLAKFLTGTEGTLATTLEATIELVPVPPAKVLLVLGYPDMASAADAVVPVLAHRPHAIEGLDRRLVNVLQAHGLPVPHLPRGAGWLMVEVPGNNVDEAIIAARQIASDADHVDHRVVSNPAEAAALWRIREDGAGLAGRTSDGRPAWPGWEDAAVPPNRLGGYLRDFEKLLVQHRLTGLPFGHFGDGCIHVRLDLPLDSRPEVLRGFLTDAADLVTSYDGSLSGEHGDGRARSELLPKMYSAPALDLFSAVKHVFDPLGHLNPGVLVDPRPLDADLRRPQAAASTSEDGFALTEDAGDLTQALHRCVGVGKCRADNSASGGFMCPSYQASRDEKDSTRGRARVLQEAVNGRLITDVAAPEVLDSLNLCLSCKACSSDCPAGVDMARYKSEVLHRTYRGRVRPVTHYTLGQLPRWVSVAHAVPALGAILVNSLVAVRPLERLLLCLAGVDTRRRAPRFARMTFDRWWRRRRMIAYGAEQQVLLWVDTFTNGFQPQIAKAAVSLLEDAGYRVTIPERRTCCGLTWISTGQLTAARARLQRLVDELHPYAAVGVPIVGLEPSCTAVLRSDLVDLVEDHRAAEVAAHVTTLAEILERSDWTPPPLDGVSVLAQPHCHHHSVMGFDADRRLLTSAGAQLEILAGCCGLAGNFGMERGHYETSVSVAENSLIPALRNSEVDFFLADGFSCRVQAEDLAGRTGLHLAELLAQPRQDPAAGGSAPHRGAH